MLIKLTKKVLKETILNELSALKKNINKDFSPLIFKEENEFTDDVSIRIEEVLNENKLLKNKIITFALLFIFLLRRRKNCNQLEQFFFYYCL